MRIRWQDCVAGARNKNGVTALKASGSKSEVVGPGRLCSVHSIDAIVTWGANSTQGVVELEGSDDPAYAGTWAQIQAFTWATSANRQDKYTYEGSWQALRFRVTTTVDGDGASITVQGNE